MKENSNHVYDFIIIGQGLAGTMAAHFLSKRTSNFLVLDAEKHTASFAAAGIINPVTGRNYVKSWMIDTLLPFAKATYDELSELLNYKLYQELNVLRTLHSIKEENDWSLRVQDEAYKTYILPKADIACLDGLVKNNYEYGEIQSALQVKLKDLILKYREHLKELGKYEKCEVNAEEILFSESIIQIDKYKCNKAIFCEGYKAMQNPLFADLPFSPAKGNAMIIRGDFHLAKNLRDQIFITPLEDGSHWVGSGYQKDISSESPDDEEQQKLETFLNEILDVPFTVEKRLSGIRPAVKTRRPIIGDHSLHKNIFLLNGLGTKGSSLAPYFASRLVEFIFDGRGVEI